MALKPRNPKYDMNAFLRTCQECGHVQKDNEPTQPPSDAFRNRKCKKCHSEALDYGSYNYYQDDD